MLVRRLEIASYASIPDDGVVRNPAWSVVETAIHNLDRHDRPWIWLRLTEEVTDDDYMTVMGGDGVYWLAVTRHAALGIDQRRLLNVERGNHEVDVWTSDQGFADYEFHTTGLIEEALSATKHFCEYGDCDPTLTWE